MIENCHICKITESPSKQLMSTDYWTVGIGNNQAYFGRAYVTLIDHKGSLSELTEAEWKDFENIVKKLEDAYRGAFEAVPLNWGCFMNNAFQEEPAVPHVHWHIFPRYKKGPVFEGVTYDDKLYGYHYDPRAERMVSDDVVEKITEKLKQHLDI